MQLAETENMTVAWRDNWLLQRMALAGGGALSLLGVWFLSPLNLTAIVLAVTMGLLVLRWPVGGFCLLAISVPWGSAIVLPGLPSFVGPTEFVVGALSLAWAASLATSRASPCDRLGWWRFIGLFLAAVGLSISGAHDLAASAREGLKWIEFAVVYLAGSTFIRSTRDVRLLATVLILGAVSQAALGFAQSALQMGPAAFSAQRAFLRAYGTFDQPNPYAGYLNLILPVSLSMAICGSPPHSRSKLLYGLAALSIGGAVAASGSRAGLLSTAAGVAVVVASTYRPMMKALSVSVLGLLCGAFLAALDMVSIAPLNRFLTSLGLGNLSFAEVNDANFSAVERAAHWLAGVRMFETHPILGVGIGNYSVAYPAYHPRGWYLSLEHAHDFYINIAAEAGILGLASYLLLVGSALWYSDVAFRRARAPLLSAVGLGATGALVAMSVHSVFDVLFVHGLAVVLALLLALVSAALCEGRVSSEEIAVDLESNQQSSGA